MAIDINSATIEELAALPGLDHELAQTLIEYREDNGGFMSLEEVADIPGCDESIVERLRNAGVGVGVTSEVGGASDTTADLGEGEMM